MKKVKKTTNLVRIVIISREEGVLIMKGHVRFPGY
jgi:hypothetical protein